jgi:mono/diheme cytochrome c family protein
MFRPLTLPRDRIRILALPAALAAVVLVAGCGRGANPDLVNGKTLFVQRCGSCHTLARAGTKGIQGPNLDAAFFEARRQGFEESGIKGVVFSQISHVRRGSIMPLNLVKGNNARDVAAYVGFAAANPGKDSGELATAGQPKQSSKPAVEQNGQLNIPADPTGVGTGGTSKVSANLKPGTYEFYCSVPGHEAGGMKGTLTVK